MGDTRENRHKMCSEAAGQLSLKQCVAISMIIALCACAQRPPEPMVACDGSPNWCIQAANETSELAWVYVDGEEKAMVRPGQKISVPIPAGETHMINSCRHVVVSSFFGTFKNVCLKPENVTFVRNQTLVIYAVGQ